MKLISIMKKRSIGTKLLLLLWVVAGTVFLSFVFFVMIRLRNQIKHTDSNYVKKEVTEYLEKRYNEKFVVMFDRGMGPVYNYVQLFAYPLGCRNSKHKFKVQGYENKWGSLDYFDSYVMIKLMDDYEAYIDPIIDEYFDDYKFYLEFESEWLMNNLPPDTKVEDLWELRANIDYPLPRLFVYLNTSQIKKFTESNVMNIATELAQLGYRGPINIICFEISELYEKKSRENRRECTTYEAQNSEGHVLFINSDKDIDYR